MRNYKSWLIRTFGLKGSWKWACKKLEQGYWVTRLCVTGGLKYKLDEEGQLRILCTFERNPKSNESWNSAKFFLSDFDAIDWLCVEPCYIADLNELLLISINNDLEARIKDLENSLDEAITGIEWWISEYPESVSSNDYETLEKFKGLLRGASSES